MNRKEFLLSMMALGGTTLTSSANISAWEKVADKMIAEGIEDTRKGKRKIDPAKAVLMSDIHICGELEDGVPKHYPYNPTSLKLRVAEILSMRRLPAHVLVFGDVAWDYGLEEDYRYASQLLQELTEAGIRVTLALGNHDRRAPFFKVFPEYAKSTLVEGRVVSIVEMPDVDIVLLDSLSERPNLKLRQSTTVSGEINQAQIDWLCEFLKGHTRPVILGAHHPLNEMKNLEGVIAESPSVVGYVYGHTHLWNKSVRIIRPRKGLHMVPTVGLPATFYGDIGFAILHSTPEAVTFEYSSKGFWWPQPLDNPPQAWLSRAEDLSHEDCKFLLK
ncbi:MAG: metallophosphoesterase [Bacteroides sp.]|nr:metallophosphoesterase [Bacteroides sp.]